MVNVPAITRYAATLSYDQKRGVARAQDWRAYPGSTSFAEMDGVAALAGALETGTVRGWAAVYLAGYGLALAARAWSGRPSEARRGAIIQSAEQLRAARPHDRRLARLVEQALAQADTAILGGRDAEQAILSFVGAEIGRADRAAERCGRIAAGLLDEQDRVLARGDPGPALDWMLAYARRDGKRPRLCVGGGASSEQLAGLAGESGVPVDFLDASALEAELSTNTSGILCIGARGIALDGSVLAERDTLRLATLARGAGLPCYALGYDGPDPDAETAEELGAVPGDAYAIVPPALVSAIVTARGIYRPEMIARYLRDGDAPLDVIPLN